MSAMMALSGSSYPAETDLPNRRKQGLGSYTMIWFTCPTTSPCARYHRNSGVVSRILKPRKLPTSLTRGFERMSCSLAY